MSYQNQARAAQELYGDDDAATSPHQGLLPCNKQTSNLTNPNVGVSNSARGQGTTLPEIVSKLRFLNVAASSFVILFHSLPIALNPFRFTSLLVSPIRLVLEAILAMLALTLLVVEARIPLLGQKVLHFMRGNHSGRQFLDMDTANGRLSALMFMAVACGLINYFTVFAPGHTSAIGDLSRNDESHEEVIDSSFSSATYANNSTSDSMTIDPRSSNKTSGSHKSLSFAYILLQCTICSPTMWFLVSLIIYTVYIMRIYPDYIHFRAFSESALSDSSASQERVAAVSCSTGGSGYQSSAPSWAKTVV